MFHPHKQADLFAEPLETLEDARGRLRHGVDDGINCPCCDRWAQAYWRTINKTMARGLWWLYCKGLRDPIANAGEVPFTDITKGPAWLLRSNQLATLRWWGLVERMPSDDSAKKHSGMWRVTAEGDKFVNRGTSVPRRVCTLFGDVIAVSDDRITVMDIREDFNYAETVGLI